MNFANGFTMLGRCTSRTFQDDRIFWKAIRSQRAKLTEEICAHFSRVVASGPFAGMKIPDQISWGDGDIAPKVLGTFEQELHETLLQFKSRAYNAVVNVGCAEGYYAIGLAMLNERWCIYAFDTEATARKVCQAAAELNAVDDRVTIRGFCSTKDLEPIHQREDALHAGQRSRPLRGAAGVAGHSGTGTRRGPAGGPSSVGPGTTRIFAIMPLSSCARM
jgi:hypothetical protein